MAKGPIKATTSSIRHNQYGKMYIKFYWWPLIISLGLSLLLTIVLNLII